MFKILMTTVLCVLVVAPACAGTRKAQDQAQALAWEQRCTEQTAAIADLIARQEALGTCLQAGVAAIGGRAAHSNVDQIARRNQALIERPDWSHTWESTYTSANGKTLRTVTTCRFFRHKTVCETF